MTSHTEHGRILDVTEETLGGSLTADTASGATTITVDDAGDFEDDGSGGWLQINGQNIQYDTVDDTAGTIHLLTGLSAAANEGDPVYVYSPFYATVSTVKTALVVVDGSDDNTDPVYAELADSIHYLPEGLRDGAGENCTLHRVSSDVWEVTAVGGTPSSKKRIKVLDDLDDVTIPSGSLADRKVLAYNATDTQWEPYGPIVQQGTVLPADPTQYTWQFFVKHN